VTIIFNGDNINNFLGRDLIQTLLVLDFTVDDTKNFLGRDLIQTLLVLDFTVDDTKNFLGRDLIQTLFYGIFGINSLIKKEDGMFTQPKCTKNLWDGSHPNIVLWYLWYKFSDKKGGRHVYTTQVYQELMGWISSKHCCDVLWYKFSYKLSLQTHWACSLRSHPNTKNFLGKDLIQTL
jgi:hypothetical protein